MKVEGLANYFDSMENEKNLNLLKGYFEGKFDSILEWYGFAEQVNKFYKTICSKRLYLLMWNEEPLDYVPKKWYKKYLSFIAQIEVLKKILYKKLE